jgi:hypothetical protein
LKFVGIRKGFARLLQEPDNAAAFRGQNERMKSFLVLACAPFLFVSCQTTSDSTKSRSNLCEVHRVAMTKRAVPYAHGMIPMSRVEAQKGEWARRQKHYPHPGDCEPATDIVLPGQRGKTLVHVCPQCEAAQKRMAANPAR